MDWFIATIVYEIICGKGDHAAQFDEQLRLIEAEDYLEAYEKAIAIGEAEAVCFPNQQSETVRWTFLAVSEIIPIQELTHGTEIWSRIREDNPSDSYREQILTRSTMLAQNLQICHLSPSLT